MKITCNCLNVIIHAKGEKCGILDKALKNILSNDVFFNEDIGTVEQVEINIQLPDIIEVYCSGPWIIHRCLNCGVYVYACNEETDKNIIIVNCALTTDDTKIAALKKSEFYSPMFGIIINYNDVSESTPGTGDEDLDQKLKQWIEQQKILTEERVQAYIEQQYTELEKSKANALREHIAISRIVSKKTISPKVIPAQITKNPLKEIQTSYEKGDNILNEKIHPNRTSLDSEVLFPLDDIADSTNNDTYDVVMSDESENNDENIQIPRREESGHFARSLPVPVPQFVQDRQRNESNNGSPNVPTDIAASIKALAKSVHGDAVFGELPRPRFSTHL